VPEDSLPPKSRWHPLSLQRLEPNKFADIVNRILDGRLSVLRSRTPHRTKRVLVTDDNEMHAQLVLEALEAELGIIADWVDSSERCVQVLEREQYDLLILDYRLPKRDGIWVIDELAERGIRIPVVMMTSFFHPQLSETISRRMAVELFDKSNGGFSSLVRTAGRMLASTAPAPNVSPAA